MEITVKDNYLTCDNFFYRMVETELIPCLRYFGIRFYAYNPVSISFQLFKYHNVLPLPLAAGWWNDDRPLQTLRYRQTSRRKVLDGGRKND